MAEVVFEILSEEIPAGMQKNAQKHLHERLESGLNEVQLSFESINSYVTARRLAVVIHGVGQMTQDVIKERRGPRVQAPEKAIEGFLSSVNLTRDQLEERQTPKGLFFYATQHQKGQPAPHVIGQILQDILQSFHWPKTMRWGHGSVTWIRPIISMVCLYDDQVIPVSYGHVVADRITQGHRFHFPKPFKLDHAREYESKLSQCHVMISHQKRRESIIQQAEEIAVKNGCQWQKNDDLLDEVCGLVEWPVVLMGCLDSAFMDLPAEVLKVSSAHHQKYFLMYDQVGQLAPYFLLVTHMEKGHKTIIQGNERVLRARLCDARFFWDSDRQVSLSGRVDALKSVVFHAQLGSVHERVGRLKQLALKVAEYFSQCSHQKVEKAAHLCKADLLTQMVGEFPQLQGVMGRYYALEQGESNDVAQAIESYYHPAGPFDQCPSDVIGVILGIADRIDLLVGFFLIHQRPTGSKDPFGLRRAALGIIRLILENSCSLSLPHLFEYAFSLYSDRLKVSDQKDHLMDFIEDRLVVYFKDQGVKYDVVRAVFSGNWHGDLIYAKIQLDALTHFLTQENGQEFLKRYKRVSNILHIEEEKEKCTYQDCIDVSLLTKEYEKPLYDQLVHIDHSEKLFSNQDLTSYLESLAHLNSYIDDFFTHVIVNDPDEKLRRNRLYLFAYIRKIVTRIADFSHIEVN